MKAKGVSQRAFAKLDGCDESLVRRGIRQGRLHPLPDGKLDPAVAGSDWRERPDYSRRGPQAAATRTESVEAPPVDLAETYAQAQRRKEIALANLRELELEQKAGRLVERDAARAAFFDMGREIRDAWLAWGPRVAIMMATEIVVDRKTGQVDPRSLTVVLSAYVRQHLEEMGEPEGPELR